MKRLAQMVILLLAGSVLAQAQEWKSVPFPLSETITGISLVTPDTIHMVTDGGKHARSYDAGKNWWGLQITPGFSLEAVHFLDGRHGLTCGRHGAIHVTSDGGESWQNISWPDSTATFVSARMIDTNTFVISGFFKRQSPFGAGILLRTTDAGKNWHRIDLPGQAIGDLTTTPEGNLICLSLGFIHRSSDGGQNWQSSRYELNRPGRMAVLSGKNGIMIGNFGLIAHSADSGKTWRTISTKNDRQYFTCAIMIDTSLGFVGGTQSSLLRSTDGGSTWKPEKLPREFDVIDIAASRGWVWAVGSNGNIARLYLK